MRIATKKLGKKLLEILAAIIVLVVVTGIVILVWRWTDHKLEAHRILRLALLVVFVPITAGFFSATLEWLWYEVLCRRSLGTVSAYNPMKVIALGCAIIAAIAHALNWLYIVMGVLFLSRLLKRDLQEWARRESRKRVKAIVVGLDHALQRVHPDEGAEVEAIRTRLRNATEKLIRQQKVSLIAEEAGNDREVAAKLQKEVDEFYSFGELKAPTVQEQQTFAASVASESQSCRHVDIRPPGAKINDADYERAMAEKTLTEAQAQEVVLVLCGERHRENVAGFLRQNRSEVESHPIQWMTDLPSE